MVGTAACASPGMSIKGTAESAPAPEPTPPAPTVPTAPRESGIIMETPAPVITIPEPTPTPTPAPEEVDYEQAWTGERMIIRTGSMTLVVEDVAAAIEQITRLSATYEGYVVSSNSWQDRNRMVGNIAIRVAAGHFDDAIRALRDMAEEVKSESTSGQDVTEEYVDLSAKLRNLEAAEAQLLKLMEQAGEVSDILEVQRELVETRGDIEQTKGRMQYLEQSSSMSYLEITLEQSKLTVEFTASLRSAKEGQNIWFEPEVSGGFEPYSYEWDFGDGSTSTEEYPSHAYKSEGTYTVSLKVTDDHGNVVPYQRDDYITVIAGWKANNTVSTAWSGMVGFGHFLVNLFIWLGIFSPLWIVIGVILYFAWWRRRKKS
jgi:hypothetical protein